MPVIHQVERLEAVGPGDERYVSLGQRKTQLRTHGTSRALSTPGALVSEVKVEVSNPIRS